MFRHTPVVFIGQEALFAARLLLWRCVTYVTDPPLGPRPPVLCKLLRRTVRRYVNRCSDERGFTLATFWMQGHRDSFVILDPSRIMRI